MTDPRREPSETAWTIERIGRAEMRGLWGPTEMWYRVAEALEDGPADGALDEVSGAVLERMAERLPHTALVERHPALAAFVQELVARGRRRGTR